MNDHRLLFLYCLFSALLLSCGTMAAQELKVTQQYEPEDVSPLYFAPYGQHHLIDRIDILYASDTPSLLHTAIRPYYHKTFLAAQSVLQDKSLVPKDRFLFTQLANSYDFSVKSQQPILRYFYRHPNYIYSHHEPSFAVGVNPIFHLSTGVESNINLMPFVNTRGAEIRGQLHGKVVFYTRVTENQARFMDFVMADRRGNRGILRGESRTKGFKNGALDFLSAEGYVSADVLPAINMQFGHGTNFIGHGFRSLLLGDQQEDYLYLKMNTRIWRFHYMNLYAEMIDAVNQFSDNRLQRKYLAAHYLSMAITKQLTIGLYEAVVHGKSDTAQPRMEWHYLNPLIFYRAIEYGLGSPDNVLLGMNVKYNFLNHCSFYGQIMVDEWKLYELLDGNGWWGNKYGIQAGLKYYDAFGISNLDLRGEWNHVRPFTYSHYNESNTYSHYRQPLAHPLGANFDEWILEIRYRPMPRLSTQLVLIQAQQGLNTNNENFGADILVTNITRTQDYNNTTGQGQSRSLSILRWVGSYMIKPHIWVDANYFYRADARVATTESHYIGIGVRMNFEGRQYLF